MRKVFFPFSDLFQKAGSVAMLLAKLNESMKLSKLLRSDHPRMSLKKKQLSKYILALKCGTGVTFPEKLLYSSSKAY